MNVDFEAIFDLLDEKEQQDFIRDHFDNRLFASWEMAEMMQDFLNIATVLDAFTDAEISDWLEDNAHRFGFVYKEEEE